MSGYEDLSECLIPEVSCSTHRKFAELNLSNPSSNELNIFDSLDLKFKTRPHFFRELTKTKCEISNEDEKNLSEKIIGFYIKSLTQGKESNQMYLNLDTFEDVKLNLSESNEK